MVGSLFRPILRGFRGGGPTGSQVEFTAYAADCRLVGHLSLRGARLSDMLNKHAQLSLEDVVATYLDGAPPIRVPRITVGRDDLYAVHLAGPRGDVSRWRSTQPVSLGIKAGPYLIRGNIHVQPGADAVAAFHSHAQMVPLTDAWIELPLGSEVVRVSVQALAVNRLFTEWVTLAPEEVQQAEAAPAAAELTPAAPEAATTSPEAASAAPEDPTVGASGTPGSPAP